VARQPRPGSGKETILVVEDTDEVRRMICHILLQHGYTVLEAADGPEALEVIGSYGSPIHLLLTDVIMPRMNGGELAERLRVTHPRLRMIFMSGYTDDAIVNRIERLAVFLAKPFTSLALVHKVREVLEAPPGDVQEELS
jgi:two-component system, cell cycle sensor histidine kinase and response regulator CckA